MTTLREAAQQALEALESLYLTLPPESVLAKSLNLRITALKAALAEEALQRLTDVHQEIEAALEQPYAEQARRVEQETHGRMRIDPATGNVSIGTPTEQPEQPEQEPVAWTTMPDADDWMFVSGTEKPPLPGEWHPLYTHPPRREPLSNEELDRLWREPMSADWEHREYARAIEAALRSKNHE